jgi:hypothetical protein
MTAGLRSKSSETYDPLGSWRGSQTHAQRKLLTTVPLPGRINNEMGDVHLDPMNNICPPTAIMQPTAGLTACLIKNLTILMDLQAEIQT